MLIIRERKKRVSKKQAIAYYRNESCLSAKYFIIKTKFRWEKKAEAIIILIKY